MTNIKPRTRLLTIPEVRERLFVLASSLDPYSRRKLRELIKHMYRRRPIRKAPPQRRNPGRAKRARIRDYVLAHPRVNLEAIAALFNVGLGRVSEALRGKRR